LLIPALQRNRLVNEPYRKNRKRFPFKEKRVNMLLSLEPLIYSESITNGEKILKSDIISGGARLIQSAYGDPSRGAMPALYDHLQTPYAYGIHELIYGYGGAVDMYVS
jgi:hypothetical protein